MAATHIGNLSDKVEQPEHPMTLLPQGLSNLRKLQDDKFDQSRSMVPRAVRREAPRLPPPRLWLTKRLAKSVIGSNARLCFEDETTIRYQIQGDAACGAYF